MPLIQDIKDAMVAAYRAEMGPGGLCPCLVHVDDSEEDVLPTEYSPLLQFRTCRIGSPFSPSGSLVAGGQQFGLECSLWMFLKVVTPTPEGTRELLRNWMTRSAQGQPKTGVAIVLTSLMANGGVTTASGDRFVIECQEAEIDDGTGPKEGPYTAEMRCRVDFISQLQ